MKLLSIFLLLLLALSTWHNPVLSQSLMAVDVGMDTLKVSITKPGTPMMIVLNKDSYRKTKNAVGIASGVRYLGDNVIKMAKKYPQYAGMHPSFLVGKRFDSKLHHIYRQRWSKIKFGKHNETESIMFDFGGQNDTYTAEALFAMSLVDAREFTESYIDGKINSFSLALPAYSDQATRLYMKQAAEIADTKIISIVDSNIASCIKYSIGRRKHFSKTEYHRVMIVDVGAYKTDASIFDCINKAESEKDSTLYPHCHLRGYGYTLKGASDIDSCVFEILTEKFGNKFKTDYSTISNNRIDHTIMNQAIKLKHLLSSVNETKFTLEQIYNGQDWSDSLSRQQIENKCSTIVDKMLSAIDQSLQVATLASTYSKDKDSSNSLPLKQVVLMGGGTRIPLVQSIIQKKTGIDTVSKSLNTDDDIALGASFKTAVVSKFFRVAHFECDSGTIFPINVTYDKVEQRDGQNVTVAHTKRLFNLMSPNRVGKVLTLKNITKDIEMTFSYDLENLPYDELAVVDSTLISRIKISGLPEAIEKHKENYHYDRLRVHISHDNFGILTVTNADAVFKRNDSNLSMLNKFTNALTDFFKDSSDNKDDELVENLDFKTDSHSEEKPKNKKNEENSQDKKSKDSTKENKTEDETTDNNTNTTNTTDNQTAFNSTSQTNSTDFSSGKNITNTTETEPPELPKKQTEELEIDTDTLHMKLASYEEIENYKNRLKDIRKVEKQREDDETARSDLESYLFEIKSKIDEQNVILKTYLNETEQTTLSQNIESVDQWFSESGHDANMTQCTEQKNKIRTFIKQATQRSKEKSLLADFYSQVNSTLETVKELFDHFISMPSNFTQEHENLHDTAQNSFNELTELHSKYSDQLLLQPWDSPILTSKDLRAKNRTLSKDAKKLADKVIAFQREQEKLMKLAEEAEKKAKAESEKESNPEPEAEESSDKTVDSENSNKPNESDNTKEQPNNEQNKPDQEKIETPENEHDEL